MNTRAHVARGRARRAIVATLAVALVAALPASAVAQDPGRAPGLSAASPTTLPVTGGLQGALPASRAAMTSAAAPAPLEPPGGEGSAPDLRAYQLRPGDAPSQMYADAIAHEGRRFDFVPGGRVDVGFRPRSDDRWPVGGVAPRALPAGTASGAEMDDAPAPDPAVPAPGRTPADDPGAQSAPDPLPVPAVGAAFVVPSDDGALAPAAVGMRREVYGFLPYWEVADSDTRVDFSVVTHLAYFSVGADADGNLKKRNKDGTLTTGWGGWTSSRMTSLIKAAHESRSRVTLTLSMFAWTSTQAGVQRALLGSPAARLNLAKQAVSAVRDRGADGINLDFEPLASGYEDEFVALVRTIRNQLDKAAPGYHLSFDTLGYPGNYPLEQALAPGGADAVFVMGYDYRTAGAAYAGSIDPLSGPAYDLTDTVKAYTSRVAAGRVILGVPYYGRAWSTVSDDLNARTRTGTKYGASSAVNYSVAVAYAAKHGRRYDSREVSAWTAYKKKNCTAAYGCVTTWRQIYYDDAATLKARYDLVNRYGLRGAGIWALGYEGTRRELYQALADKFLRDTTPPRAGIVTFSNAARRDEGFLVSWTAADDWSGVVSCDVQVSIDGGAWSAWLTGTKARSATYLGRDGHGYAFRVRARDGKGNVSAWTVSSVFRAAPSLAKGGFLRVTADTLNLRSAPSTGATRLGSASSGDVFAITDGPVKADGYTWFEVTGPLATWGPVDDVDSSVWLAVSGSGTTNATARRAPNAALVGARIRAVGFAGAGSASLGTSAAAVAARSFSPNGDDSEDTLGISWDNRSAFDEFALRIVGTDGRVLDSFPLRTTAAGRQAATWNGTAKRAALPDGTYLVQLVGTSAGSDDVWPAASPAADGIPAQVAVKIDRKPPALKTASASGLRLSPNGDGHHEAMAITGTGSKSAVRWDVTAAPLAGVTAGVPVRRISGTGRTASARWLGTADDGKRVADGAYRVTLRVYDAAGNSAARSWTARVDASGPRLSVTASPAAFSPNGDGAADTTRLRWSSDEPMTGKLRVMRGTTKLRAWAVSGSSGSITWDGRDTAGRPVRDGSLRIVLKGRDSLLNAARTTTPLVVDRTVGWLAWSPGGFFPQDGDRLLRSARLSVRVARASRLTLRILDGAGREIRRPWSGREVGAGTETWRWDGRTSTGAWAPQGRYVAELTAAGPLGTTILRRPIDAAAFTASLSTRTPAAGTVLSVTFRTVEPLARAPRATFRQAGRAAVPMTVVRRSNGSWRATIVVSAGAAGPATVTLSGRDTLGGKNRTTFSLTVR